MSGAPPDAPPDAPAGGAAELFARVAALYENDLRVPENNVCKLRCDARFKRPLLPWHIGEAYAADPRRLVIVGKPHREDEPTENRPSGTQDGRRTADRLYATRSWPFWRYTREMLARVYGSAEEGWRRVSLTTIVKCTSARAGPEAHDRTSAVMKTCCLGELGVLRRELAILEPRSLVLYTGRGYDDWIAGLPWGWDQRWRDVTHRLHLRTCGDLPLHWWEGEIAGAGDPVRVLRVGHPQGKPLDAWAELLSAWVRAGRLS